MCGALMRSARARAAMIALADASGWFEWTSAFRGGDVVAAVYVSRVAAAISHTHLDSLHVHLAPAGMPVAVMLNSKGLFPEDHPSYIGGHSCCSAHQFLLLLCMHFAAAPAAVLASGGGGTCAARMHVAPCH